MTRSRRRLRERVVLAVTRAAVYRCRDCKNRFLVGAQWRFVILALLSVVVAATFVVSMQLVRRSRQEAAAQADAPKPVRGYRPLRTPLPRGLPPLSSVPRPAVNPKKP